MSIDRVLTEYAKFAPTGYVHVSAFAKSKKLSPKRVSALAAKSPDAVRIGPYIFVPWDLKVTIKQSWTARGQIVDRYYLGDGKRRRRVGNQ